MENASVYALLQEAQRTQREFDEAREVHRSGVAGQADLQILLLAGIMHQLESLGQIHNEQLVALQLLHERMQALQLTLESV